MVPWLAANDPFPPLEHALEEPNGLLAAGADLGLPRLLEAYRTGIFPWFSEGQPVLWWSPDPRMVLFPAELRIPRSLRKRMARRDYEVRSDTAFAAVIRACAEPRAAQEGTWITAEMIAAYRRLHEAGHAHSVETWIDGELVGGLYGVAIGQAFFGESMFTAAPDASKIALVSLVRHLERNRYRMIDCQMRTAHLARFGAREIPRADFKRKLAELVNYPRTVWNWRLEDDLSE